MEKQKLIKYLLSALLLSGFLFSDLGMINAAGKIGRPVRIVSLCFQGNNYSEILKIVDQEGAKGADLILLPEAWRGERVIETLKDGSISDLSALAKKHNTYIISPIERNDGGTRYNTAVLIDRNGKVVGNYDKLYPYWGEFDLNPPVKPGIKGVPVFETDFGKIGMAICFDANFPEVWQALKDNGAEVVFWSSAYSAGLQLQAYALLHHYYIVTSTYTKDCQVFDITGARVLDEKSDNITIARITLDLDRAIYHENFNMDKLDKLLKDHGEEIEKEIAMQREQWFVLRAKKEGVSARALAREYGMEELTDYQSRSRMEIDRKRGFSFKKKLLSSE